MIPMGFSNLLINDLPTVTLAILRKIKELMVQTFKASENVPKEN